MVGNPEKNKIRYKGISHDLELQYSLDGNRLKEEIILLKRPKGNQFIFDVRMEGLTYAKDESGIIWFSDAKTHEQLFYME